MGGSGSSYTPRGRTSGCADIAFTTAINTPGNLTGLKKGDLLTLEKNTRLEVQFKRSNGKVAGKLFSGSLLKIISCMDRGFGYSARVLNIEDDVCRVEVWCSESPKK